MGSLRAHPVRLGVSWAAVRAAMAPRPGRWGLVPGVRAAVAAAVVLGGALALADLAPEHGRAWVALGGIAYLGVACAVSFVGDGGPRSRVARVAGQAAGAANGMTLGALVPATVAWVVAAAVVVGFAAGVVGRVGPACTGGAVMAVVGLAYTQFGRLAMPWWEPVLAYLAGSTVLLLLALATVRPGSDRRAVAAVFEAAADLVDAAEPAGAACDSVDGGATGEGTDAARHRLARAWAAAREAVLGYRLRPRSDSVAVAWVEARDAADQAARRATADRAARRTDGADQGTAADPAAHSTAADQAAWRASARALRERRPSAGLPGAVGPGSGAVAPGSGAVRRGGGARPRAVLRPATEPAALGTGARIAVCVGVATALALALRTPAHAFWIPLTVAVVVRPEYGSVLVRSLHRLVGTVVGVALVALLLTVVGSPELLAATAALSLGLAAFGATRLYGLAVVGITGSALFSVALTASTAATVSTVAAGFEPWARLVDTVLGCAVALVLGVLLWPHRGLPDQPRAFARAAAALADFADHPCRETAEEAYRRAHAWRAQLERDLTEPDPAHAARGWLPVAHRLEHLCDRVAGPHPATVTTAVSTPLRAPAHTPAEAAARLARLTDLLEETP